MSAQRRTAVFKLNGKRPEDLPIERLAQYMRVLSDLVGPSEKVRVRGITASSVKFAVAVDPSHYATLVERMATAKNPDRASSTVTKAVRQLEKMVTEDNVTAEFSAGRTRLLYLRGYARETGAVLGPLAQRYSVRGQIIGLEGRDATKHVRLLEYGTGQELRGDFRSAELGRLLTQHLWGAVVELSGAARLLRYPDGRWELQSFHIDTVTELEVTRISDVVRALQGPLAGEGSRGGAAERIDKLRN